MQNFKIEIPNPKLRLYNLIGFLIACMNLLCFAIAANQFADTQTRWIALVGFLLNVPILIVWFIRKKKPLLSVFKPVYVFIVCALIWFYLHAYWIGISLLAFAVMGMISQRKYIVQIGEDGLQYPSFPTKFYPWEQVELLLLKDNVLTMELAGNRFLQFSLPETSVQSIDPQQFNQYCANKISNNQEAEKNPLK